MEREEAQGESEEMRQSFERDRRDDFGDCVIDRNVSRLRYRSRSRSWEDRVYMRLYNEMEFKEEGWLQYLTLSL